MTPRPLKIIFAGTPEFAATALAALLKSPHEILAVYTQPDRPAGRGLQLSASPVKVLAEKHALPVLQPQHLKDPLEQEKLAAFKADLMVVAAYGLLLPPAVLSTPRLGCINIHASLLPRWRGAAPIQRAILNGDDTSGITIMQMDQGLDTGPILYQALCPISLDTTSASLHQELAELGAATLLNSLVLLTQGELNAKAQDPQLATHAAKIRKEEACIDWQQSALEIDRLIRAFNPWPIAYTHFQGETLRIHQAKVLSPSISALPATILASSADGLDVATGQGALRLLKVQALNSRALPIKDFLNARQKDFTPGLCFE